jgi:hypothetical protein
MFSCKEVSRRISESMDRAIPMHQRFFIRMHIMMCKYCERFRKQLLFLRQMSLFSQSPGEAAESVFLLSEEARERIKSSLKAAH